MDKIQERIKQQLQKQDAWDDWDSWEDWGKEIEGSIKLLSTGVDSLLSAFNSFNQNQTDLKNMIDSLNKKMEKQPTPKSDGTKLQCAIEKMQKQVDGMNNKLHNGLQESKQHKEQLEELDKKLINEQQASLKLKSAMDKMGERLAEVEENLNLCKLKDNPKSLKCNQSFRTFHFNPSQSGSCVSKNETISSSSVCGKWMMTKHWSNHF